MRVHCKFPSGPVRLTATTVATNDETCIFGIRGTEELSDRGLYRGTDSSRGSAITSRRHHLQQLRSNGFLYGGPDVTGSLNSISAAGDMVQTAAAFASGINASLSQIALALQLRSGTNAFLVMLNQNSNGAPGAVLEQWQITNAAPFQSAGFKTLTSTGGIQLQSGSTYWLVVSALVPNSTTGGVWDYSPAGHSWLNRARHRWWRVADIWGLYTGLFCRWHPRSRTRPRTQHRLASRQRYSRPVGWRQAAGSGACLEARSFLLEIIHRRLA